MLKKIESNLAWAIAEWSRVSVYHGRSLMDKDRMEVRCGKTLLRMFGGWIFQELDGELSWSHIVYFNMW